jgi:hypothetical protein
MVHTARGTWDVEGDERRAGADLGGKGTGRGERMTYTAGCRRIAGGGAVGVLPKRGAVERAGAKLGGKTAWTRATTEESQHRVGPGLKRQWKL